MNNPALNYQLRPFIGLVNHDRLRTLFARDIESEQPSVADLALAAQVRSGDYFITLATTLDQLGKEATDYHVRVGIEEAVSDLIYLQDHYEVSKKSQSK